VRPESGSLSPAAKISGKNSCPEPDYTKIITVTILTSLA
jgi:hypothetical protein